MSARALRRLAAQMGPSAAAGAADADAGEVEDDEVDAAPRRASAFALLMEDEAEDEGEGEEEAVAEEAEEAAQETKAQAAASAAKKKKKNRKKNKQAAKDHQADGADDADDALLEAMLKEKQRNTDAPAGTSAPASQAPPLSVDTRTLRADEELVRLFGRGTIYAQQQSHNGRRNFAMQPRGTRQFHDAARRSRSAILVPAHDHWPPYDGSLSVRPKNADGAGNQHFVVAKSNKYNAASQEYALGQMTMNLNAIVAALRACPYHLECNLAMAEYHWGQGEHERAQEHVERILFAFESAAASSGLFRHAGEGRARLSMEQDEHDDNGESDDDESAIPMDPARTIVVALFKHSQSLSRRGCHGAAFSACQLAYQLDASTDRAGALHQLDYAALRAGKRDWLVRALTAGDRGIVHRGVAWALYPSPSFAWSLALREQAEDAGIEPEDLDSSEAPDAVCRRAVCLHPRMAVMLVAKLLDKGAGIDTAMKNGAAQLEAFASTHPDPLAPGASLWDVPDSLLRLYEIAVERQHALWRAGSALAMLRRALIAVASSIADGDEQPCAMGLAAMEWMVARASSFPALSEAENPYRHLQAAGYAEGGALIVPEDEGAGGGDADDDDFEHAPAPPPPAAHVPAEIIPGTRLIDDDNLAGRAAAPQGAVGLFLETLLPWVRVAPGEAGPEPQPAPREPE